MWPCRMRRAQQARSMVPECLQGLTERAVRDRPRPYPDRCSRSISCFDALAFCRACQRLMRADRPNVRRLGLDCVPPWRASRTQVMAAARPRFPARSPNLARRPTPCRSASSWCAPAGVGDRFRCPRSGSSCLAPTTCSALGAGGRVGRVPASRWPTAAGVGWSAPRGVVTARGEVIAGRLHEEAAAAPLLGPSCPFGT